MSVTDQQAVDLLTEIVATPSPCGREETVAAILLSAMGSMGFEASGDAVGNVAGQSRATAVDGAADVVILGHMDTAPGIIAVEERDGILYGRGTVDAKGPLATAVVAAARAAGRATARVTVIGAVQEEGLSLGARHLVSRPAPDHLIIAEPSGWNAITLGYKGSQRFSVTVTQGSSHSAAPGATAAERAVDFWNDLVRWCREHNGTGDPDGFGSLTPTLIGMASSDNGLRDTASLSIGMRLPPGVSPVMAQAQVRDLLPEGAFNFGSGEEAVRSGKNNRLVAGFLRAIREEGATPRFKLKTGTSDMNIVGPVWQCPMLAYGPGDSRLDHTANEHIRIDDYLRAIRVLTSVLEDL